MRIVLTHVLYTYLHKYTVSLTLADKVSVVLLNTLFSSRKIITLYENRVEKFNIKTNDVFQKQSYLG